MNEWIIFFIALLFLILFCVLLGYGKKECEKEEKEKSIIMDNQVYKFICENCGCLIDEAQLKGENLFGCIWGGVALIIAIILFFTNLFSGLIFMILYLILGSLSKQKSVCTHCGSENIIPINTPKGQELYNKYNKKADR